MKTYLFVAIAMFGSVRLCSASAALDCNEARNVNACETQSMLAAQTDLESFVSDLHKKLAGFVNQNYANRMDALQRQWMSWADRQCEHSRGIYGKGREGALNAITCRELLYKDRLQELKRIYADALEQR